MTDLAWEFLQIFLLTLISLRNKNYLPIFICLSLLAPVFALTNKTAVVDIYKLEKKSGHPQLSVASSHSNDARIIASNVLGRFSKIGKAMQAEGRLHMLSSSCEEEDEKGFARLPENWIAVFHLKERSGSSSDSPFTKCSSVIDRMQKALMFGASAIIILSLNPKLFKELDKKQMFSFPVIFVDALENVTNFVHLLNSKLKMKAKVYQSSAKSKSLFPTLTLWATCGRPTNGHSYHEWDGVVCFESDIHGKADPTNFWNFFYSGTILILMLLAIKTARRYDEWGEAENEIEMSLREMAYQALSVMKIRKYKETCFSQSELCAICLEMFFKKQKLRVLPCSHEFHTKCVDPWLVKNRTCPLCKLDIVEKLKSSSEQDSI